MGGVREARPLRPPGRVEGPIVMLEPVRATLAQKRELALRFGAKARSIWRHPETGQFYAETHDRALYEVSWS